MRKPTICICKTKGADQLQGNHCFRYIDSTMPLLPNFKPLANFCGHTGWFVSDLVDNAQDRFSCVVVKISDWTGGESAEDSCQVDL